MPNPKINIIQNMPPELSFFKVPTSNQAYKISQNTSWEISQQIQVRGQERLLEQKTLNYQEFLGRFWQLLTSVDALKVEKQEGTVSAGYHGWAAFWDMQNDIRNLEIQLTNSYQKPNWESNECAQSSEELQKQLKKLKNKLKQYITKIFGHDVLDHLLNGQNQKLVMSDATNELSDAVINKGVPEFYLLENGSQVNVKYALEDLWLKDGLREAFRSDVHVQVINLLPSKEKAIIWDWLIRYNNLSSISPKSEEFKKVLEEFNKPIFQEIMQQMAEFFTRGQVLRGALALAYENFNVTLLKMMKNGINLEKNEFLDKLKIETMVEIGKINEEFQKNPQNFDNYTTYFKNYRSELQFVDEYEPIAKMRERMYLLIEEVMSDDLMEKLARQMLAENKNLVKK